MRAALVAAVLLLAPLAGCLESVAAGIPQALAQAHGWRENATARQTESRYLGLARADTRAWEDRGADGHHPGKLWVYTLKAPVTPDDDALVPRLRERIEAESAAQGIRLGPVEENGERALRNGATTSWFAYNGTAQGGSSLFTERNAEVHIFGEVFPCRPARTVVVLVAIAQVTDARTVGGVLTQPNRDWDTWREIVADPSGSVEGVRGNDGLAWNVACA